MSRLLKSSARSNVFLQELSKNNIFPKIEKYFMSKYCEAGSTPMTDLMKEIVQKTQDTDWDALYDNGELQFKMVVGCLSGHLEGIDKICV